MNPAQIVLASNFVIAYPHLMSLYEQLMACTNKHIREKNRALEWALAAVEQAISQRYVEKRESREKARQAVFACSQALFDQTQREAQECFDNTVADFLNAEEKRAMADGELTHAKEMIDLETAFQNKITCYLELGLDSLIPALQREQKMASEALFERFLFQRRPIEIQYLHVRQQASLLYDETISKAKAVFDQATAPYSADNPVVKSTVEAEGQQKQKEVKDCHSRHEELTSSLTRWKETQASRRMAMITSFLNGACPDVFEEQLRAAISAIRALD